MILVLSQAVTINHVSAALGVFWWAASAYAQPVPPNKNVSPAVKAQRAQRRRVEFYGTRAYPGPAIPPGARLRAIGEMERMMAEERKLNPAAVNVSAWTSIGPRPTNTLAESGPGGGGTPWSSGRVTAAAVDPRDANVVYIGSASGGVWKTTDGGQNWKPLTDDQPSMATGSIAVSPSNPDIVYVGTGEDNNSGDSYYGAGVLKSIDGGATWTQLSGPFAGPFSSSRTSGGGARIAAIAVHPTDPNTVLAAVDRAPVSQSGIYRTSDGGVTWTLVQGGAVGTDVIFNPANPAIVYAALGSAAGSSLNGVYKSSDSGITWSKSGGTIPAALPTTNVGRISLAIAPSSPNIIYAGIQNSAAGSLLGLFKSTDAAQTWNRLGAPDYCNPQCNYDNVIRVSPSNPNLVVAAGLPPWRSLDGGVSWLNIAVGPSGIAAHTDHHALAFSSDGKILYAGNDGGVFSTSNPGAASPTWSNLNSTLAITEFNSNISIHPSDPNMAWAGTQDNGTQMYRGNLAWDQVEGGDGSWSAIDPAIPGIRYGSFEALAIYKINAQTGTSSWVGLFSDTYPYLINGIAPTDRTAFYAPLVMDPSNPVRLYAGTQRVYQTSDGAGRWTPISPDLAGGSGVINTIGASASFPGTLAVGTSTGKVQVTNMALQSTTPFWLDRSAGLPGRSISRVVFDPETATTLYATVSGFSGFLLNDNLGHVFKSTTFGETWADISGNLPNIPVNDLVVDPDQLSVLYIATDIGVFQSADGGATWSTLSKGLPRVLVTSLNLHRPSRILRASTSGRSMWDLSVPLAGPSAGPKITSISPSAVNSGATPVTLTVTGSNFIVGSVVRWNGTDRPTTFVNSSTLRVTISGTDLSQAGRATAVVFNPVAGGGLSNSVNVPVGGAPTVSAEGITSAATTSVSGPLVPGSVHTLYGSNLAPAQTVAGAAPLPYTLGGVTIEVNSIPAPLFFVSPTQINFQAPWDLEGHNSASLTVLNGSVANAPLQVNVAVTAPAIFTADGSGSGQGAILIASNGAVAAPSATFPTSRPAAHGEFVSIYATGLGPVSRIQTNGTPKPVTTAPAITQNPVVMIGGVAANVTFSGLAPATVGVYQINVQVPDAAPSGNAVPVVLSIGGLASNTVTLAIAP